MRHRIFKFIAELTYRQIFIAGAGTGVAALLIAGWLAPAWLPLALVFSLLVLYGVIALLVMKARQESDWAVKQLSRELLSQFQDINRELQTTQHQSREQLESVRQQLQTVEEQLTEGLATTAAKTQEQIDVLQAADRRHKEQLEKLTWKINREQELRTRKQKRERAERIAAFARRDGSRTFPPDVLLMVSIHRTGSTWLVDMLRCHPAIEMDPSAIVFREMGLHGGRYPHDLCDGPDADYEIENVPGLGAVIPRFTLPTDQYSGAAYRPHYALEKIHPQFFSDNAAAFAERVREITEYTGTNIRFLYSVRAPQAMLTSFLSYKERNPDWYHLLEPGDIAPFMDRAHAALQELAQTFPGPIIDYAVLKQHTTDVLLHIYRHLWGTLPDEAQARALAEASQRLTTREKRKNTTETPFLGQQESEARVGDEAYAAFFEQYADAVQSIQRTYEAILKLPQCYRPASAEVLSRPDEDQNPDN